MNDVAKGAEKAGGAFEKFGKESDKLADTIGQQKIRLAKLKEDYADLYLTLGAGDEKTQKAAEKIEELSGKLDTNQKALDEARAAADSFDSTMQDIPGTMDEAGNSTSQFGSVLDELIPKFTKAQLIRNGAEALVDFGKEAVKQSAVAETAFSKVQTLLSDGTDMDAYFKTIKQGSMETGVSLSDFSEAVYQAISASVDQADAVQFTTQAIKLSRGGFTDAATAVDILTTAINAYGLEASDATSIADMLITTQNLGKTTVDELAQAMGRVIPTAKAFGVDMVTLNSAYAVMTKNGIATAETTTYLSGMLNELGKSGTTASNVLKEKTGMSFTQLMNSGYSLTDVLTILQNEADRAGIALSDMFGSQEAGKAANVITSNLADMNDIMGQMAESAGAVGKAYAIVTDTEEAKWEKLENNMSVRMATIGDAMKPITSGLLDFAIDLTGDPASGVREIVESASSADEAAQAVENLKQQIAESYELAGTPKYDALVAALADAEQKYNDLSNATTAADTATENAGLSAEEKAQLFTSATEEYTTAATALLEQYQATYESTLSNVEGWFGPFDAASTKIKTSFDDIQKNMQSQIDFNNQYADNLQYLADNGLGSLGDALQSYGADGSAYASAIVEKLQAVGGATTEEGKKIVESMTSMMDGMKESQSAVAQNFTDMDGQFAEKMKTLSDQYAETIQGLDKSGEAMEAATSTISSFISGIDTSKSGIMSTMGDIGSQMTKALQSSLGDVHTTVYVEQVVMASKGRAIGMDYVPYNGMPATLHRGEAILNAPEAEKWRKGKGRGNSQGITIVQNIQSVPQTPIQLAAATQAMFEQARWAI
uniref:Minor tail protein n=1 Tax=Siphoviridae sp. ctgEn20 TaxID=2825606 RepID=A0A8S5P5W2_9CAUD|nr:MAG TPA: minor tail protein [Siphoviridae sp. ctgEn20]